MPYINANAKVKAANIKSDGVVEIKLESNVNELVDQFNSLSGMVGEKVEINMETVMVNFNVTMNAQTNRPIREYKVNQEGVVEEVKPTQEQQNADQELGLPEENAPTTEEEKELDREKIDQFIKEGLAPNYDDLPADFSQIVKRRLEGESYLKLANELDLSSGKIVDLADEYRRRVAPLAEKWWEWKDDQENGFPPEGRSSDEELKNDDNEDKDEGAA